MVKSTFDKKSQMTCWCNRNLQRKKTKIILKCNSPTFTIRTEYLYFCTPINSEFQQLSPPPPRRNPQHLTVVNTGGGHFNLTWMGWGTSTQGANRSIRTNTWSRMLDIYIYFRSESLLKHDSICWIPDTYSLHLTLSYSVTDNHYTLLINCMYVSWNLSVLNSSLNHTAITQAWAISMCIKLCCQWSKSDDYLTGCPCLNLF